MPLPRSKKQSSVHPGDKVFDVAVPAPALLKVLPLLPDGAAVLIQKPMGETLDEAHAIVDLCHRKGLIAAVNFQLRWAPTMLAARRITDAGLLGQLHDIEIQVSVHMPWQLWSFLSTAPRLEILYHSIHYIDLVRSWLGNPVGVYAKTVRSPRTPTLAATKTVLTMDYGEWMRVHISTNHSHDFSLEMQRSYVQWEGTRGAMRAVMGVNLDYPKGKPDSLSYIEGGRNQQGMANPPDAWQLVPGCLHRLDEFPAAICNRRIGRASHPRRRRTRYNASGGGSLSLQRTRRRSPSRLTPKETTQ